MTSRSSSHSGRRLSELGEFEILQSIVLPRLEPISLKSAVWSDAARIAPPLGKEIVVTSDPAPIPASWHVGPRDYTTYGWYAVVVNTSDIAAAGADPVAALFSVDAPADMLVDDLDAFFEGIVLASQAMGLQNAGGNLRQSSLFACHGFIVGAAPDGGGLTRSGAQPGDAIVAVGDLGGFTSAFLDARDLGIGKLTTRARMALERPTAQIGPMQQLRDLINAASDASDGVLAAIDNIAQASGLTAFIDLDALVVSPDVASTSARTGIAAANLLLFWGGWQVLVAVDPGSVEAVLQVPGTSLLGRFESGQPGVYSDSAGRRLPLRLLRNESFTATGLTSDFLSHIDQMLDTSIIDHS